MPRVRRIAIFVFSVFFISIAAAEAQTTHNLEIVFQKSYWRVPDSVWVFGISLSSAGDLNGDGFDDIVAGGSKYDPSVPGDTFWLGRAFVFHGGSPMDTVVDLVLLAGGAGQPSMSICSGDLNGDSISDVVVGQSNAGDGYGAVSVYFGGPFMDSLPDLVLTSQQYASYFGSSVSCGDVNGDAYLDLIVGSFFYNFGQGRVYIYHGGPALDTLPDVILTGQSSEGFGMSVGGGGDVNSDGFDDVVVGAWDNDEAYPGAGKIYVFLGGDPMGTFPHVWMHGEGAGHRLGVSNVCVFGSANGDTYDDVLTGTPFYDSGVLYPGKVYGLYGGSPMDSFPDIAMVGRTDSSALGMWSSGGGRVTAAPYDGMVGGAPWEARLENYMGAAYLWLGGSSPDTTPDAWLRGRGRMDVIGYRVACAGDVDANGFDEIMVSNYPADSLTTVWVCRYTGTGVEEIREARSRRQEARLFQNEPNPFTGSTLITYSVASAVHGQRTAVNLSIYDLSGRLVKVLVDGWLPTPYSLLVPSGVEGLPTSVVWDGKDSLRREAPSGVYFCTLSTAGYTVTRKMILIR